MTLLFIEDPKAQWVHHESCVGGPPRVYFIKFFFLVNCKQCQSHFHFAFVYTNIILQQRLTGSLKALYLQAIKDLNYIF